MLHSYLSERGLVEWTSTKKKLIPLLLASIIVPVSIFVGLNRPSQPTISREISVSTVEWNFTRPNYPYSISKHIPIEELVTNSYKDDIVTVNFDLFMSSYFEDSPTYLADYINFKLVFSANLTNGFIYELQIRFTAIHEGAEALDVNQDDGWVETRNLLPPSSSDSYYSTVPAYISTRAVGNPSDCYLKMLANWFFFDKNNINHETTATADLVFYNGSEYVRILIPINLAAVLA